MGGLLRAIVVVMIVRLRKNQFVSPTRTPRVFDLGHRVNPAEERLPFFVLAALEGFPTVGDAHSALGDLLHAVNFQNQLVCDVRAKFKAAFSHAPILA
jgi:hypothetical protein